VVFPDWRGPVRVITWNFCAREIILAANVLSIKKSSPISGR